MRDTAIVIDVERQQLVLLLPGGGRRAYPVSTSKTGVAIESEASTFRTPVGVMYIAEKVGSGNPPGTRFVNRKSTGIERIHTAPLRGVVPEDQIMTRILWLDGMEWGVNKGLNRFGASVDAKERSIYIHGTNNEFTIGEPASQGCIRMRNKDVLELFEMIEVGTLVYIG